MRFVRPHHFIAGVICAAMCIHSALAQQAPPATPTAAGPRVVEIPGTTEAFESADLYAKVSGYVVELDVDLGDSVKAGQVLAVLDAPEIKKQLLAAQATTAAREANLKLAAAGVQQAQAKLDVTKRQLQPVQSQAKLKEQTFKRKKELFDAKAITDQDLDETQYQLDSAQANVEVAKSQVTSAAADLEAAKATETFAAAQVALAKADTETAQAMEGYTRIVAPFDGVITRRTVDRGVLVQAATTSRTWPLFNIQRVDIIRVFADIPESEAVHVVKGTAATVKAFGQDGPPIATTVTRIASAISPATRTMRIEIDIPNTTGKLMHGMFVQVALTPDVKPIAAAARN